MDRQQILEVLADAAEQYQSRGMYKESRWCINKYEHLKGENFTPELELKIQITLYGIESSLGSKVKAESALDKAKEMILSINGHDRRKLEEAKLNSHISWHEGVGGNIDGALAICHNSVEKILPLKEKYPLGATLIELELKKNYLYHSRRAQSKDATSLKEECLNLFQSAGEIYMADPENYRIIDIIGFICNLYGEYTIENLKECQSSNSSEVGQILNMFSYAEKIRGREYRSCPDDIWAIRGYAWCHHVRARLINWLGDKNTSYELLQLARQIRLSGEYKYPLDLGLKEDLIKNCIDIMKLSLLKGEELKTITNKAKGWLEFIKEREGLSIRVVQLSKELDNISHKKALAN